MILAVATLLASSLLGDLVSDGAAPAPAVAEAPAAVEAVTKATPKAETAEAQPPAKKAKKEKKPSEKRSVKITSERTDYDRKDGVIMFDKNVFVDDAEYKMHADRIFVFLDGTNELKRIVAVGNVAITNDSRVGTCARATYSKAASKIVMHSDGTNVLARLVDNGRRKSEVEGRKITFWVDTEQVEVEGSTVTLDAGGFDGKEGAKKLLGR